MTNTTDSPLHGALPQELIRHKRDGHALSPDDLRGFIRGVTDGTLPDYQIAAMLMAIFFRGMTDAELAVWADAMTRSGDVLDLSRIDRPKIDKHSTGGVGDKISLPLAPAVAACGVAVPMVSGRGLGHSGGTLDKLEAIPGFSVTMTADRFIDQVDRLGVALIGQTDAVAPADRRLYALRDVTSTVESIPLIASSIMSKKLAEGIDGLVLDCKVGHGAFMRTIDDARALARAIAVIGAAAGVRVVVAITDMDTPIGRWVGHAVEVAESIEVLRGGGPADTRELTCALGAEMLVLADAVRAGLPLSAHGVHPGGGGAGAGPSDSGSESDRARDAALARARGQIADALDSGRALEVFRRVVQAQGGDPRVCDDPAAVMPAAAHTVTIEAERAGVVTAVAARDIGIAAAFLGGGRTRVDDVIDPAVGIALDVRVGDRVDAGQPLARLVHNGRGIDRARALVTGAIAIMDGDGVPGDDVPGARPDDGGPGVDPDAAGGPRSRIIEVLR